MLAPSCRIEIDLADAGSGLASWAPRIDGEEAPIEALAGPWEAGAHAVEAVAIDKVGNEGSVGPLRFTVDAAGPEISWRVASAGAEGDGGETFYRPPVEVAAQAMDTPAGLARLESSTDGGAYRAVAGAVTADGDHLFLRATDQVGNVSEARASWSIDVEPPEIRLETGTGDAVAPGSLQVERGATIRVRAIDRDAGIESATYSLSVESADIGRRWWWFPPQEEPLPEEIVFSFAGRLTLEVEAVDRLGNRSTARWDVVVRRPGGGGP